METAMNVLVIDILGLVLIATGLTLVFRRPGRAARPAPPGVGGDPGAYERRIAGTMMAAFGLALGMMVTLFHFVAAD
jgi:hypothetical protein